MGNIKDLEVWIEYKNGVEQLPQSSKISKVNQKPKVRLNAAKPLVRTSSFIDKKVNTLNKAELKKFKSESYIDLHGHTKEIDYILEDFCINCIMSKFKYVTIITGKGRGILKEATEIWLMKHPEFIVAFAGIKDSMQEIGAYAVKLRLKDYLKKR